MGWARIIEGGPTGRYTIELDWGESTRTAVLAALGARVADLDAKLAIAEAKVIDAEALETAAMADVTAQLSAYIAAAASLPPGSPKPDSRGFQNAMAKLQKLRQSHAGLRLTVEKLKFERSVALDRVTFWTNMVPKETRQAWCASLTEDKPTGSLVGTLDIKGESDLIVIAPEARGWQPSDGVLTAREMMSPEQAFWNAAALPGWQKFKPTYRWGTVASINHSENHMNVDLGEARSSAQRLDINQASSLAAVPIVYGACNSYAFKVGDRVVVQFQGQDWTQPLVIGFLDNPRGCGWTCIGAKPFGASSIGIIYFATTQIDRINALLAAPASAWKGRVSTGPSDFNPLTDEEWPGHASIYASGLPYVTYDPVNDETAYFKTHPVPFGAGMDLVSMSGFVRRADDSGLSLPSKWVGVVELQVSGTRYAPPSFYTDLPSVWAEVLVQVGSDVIFNVAARATNTGAPMNVDTLGGIVPIVTEYSVEPLVHTLYQEGL